MDKIDAIYTDYPFYGARRIQCELHDRFQEYACRPYIRKLMQFMGIEAIYPKPKTSASSKVHEKYPYLLRGKKITQANQVWGTDITYIRLEDEWAYLVAILVWFTRYVVGRQLSLSIQPIFFRECLNKALRINTPGILYSDQGSQLQTRGLSQFSKITILGLARMAEVDVWIIFSLNASGEPSNMKMYTSKITGISDKPTKVYRNTLTSTTTSEGTNLSAIKLPQTYILINN
ncbi:DDE-type integrase/transposase/recombinase [Patescibacteria group bacterium]|nr:DDE-type integrase/transposase/recombinase [Patescibacteria group bacterium]